LYIYFSYVEEKNSCTVNIFLKLFWKQFFFFHVPDAGQCFCKAAEIQIKLQSKHQAASEFVNAATCYKKGDPNGMI
jgi:hypothetical protein